MCKVRWRASPARRLNLGCRGRELERLDDGVSCAPPNPLLLLRTGMKRRVWCWIASGRCAALAMTCGLGGRVSLLVVWQGKTWIPVPAFAGMMAGTGGGAGDCGCLAGVWGGKMDCFAPLRGARNDVGIGVDGFGCCWAHRANARARARRATNPPLFHWFLKSGRRFSLYAAMPS